SLARWRGTGAANGQVPRPAGVATDAGGNVLVTDYPQHRVQKFVTPPAIAIVSDIGNDQGRQVRLRVSRCSADVSGSGAAILRYDVFRRVDPLPGQTPTGPATAGG